MIRADPVAAGKLKRLTRKDLLELNSKSEQAGFSGRRSLQWIESKVESDDELVVRPLLWEDSPRRCLRCSVIFVDKEHGLGQLLLDMTEDDFGKLPTIGGDQLHTLVLRLIDHVKILPPILPIQRP